MEKFKNVLHSLGMTDVSNGVCTGIEWPDAHGEYLESVSPVDGSIIGKIKQATADDYEGVVVKAQSAFKVWRKVPAPKRGEIAADLPLTEGSSCHGNLKGQALQRTR